MNERELYREKMRAEFRKMQADFDKLQAEMDKATLEGKAALEQQMEQVKQKQAEFKTRAESLQDASEQQWEKLKGYADVARDEFADGLSALANTLRSNSTRK